MIQAHPPTDHAWVVDASVGLKLVINSQGSNWVHELFSRLAHDPPVRLYVPDLFYVEIANVLWKYVRWQELPPADANEYLTALARLALYSTPAVDLMAVALDLAVEYQITVYDASYLALAQRLKLRLLTFDAKLVRAVDDPMQVLLLEADQYSSA